MPTTTREAVRIEGLKELQFALRQAEARLPRELSKTNKEAARVVAVEAQKRAPKVTGNLAKSIRPLGQQRRGIVAMGSAKVPYASVQEFGWPNRNIVAQPFLYPAIADKMPEVEELYLDLIDDLTQRAFPIPFG